MITTVSTVKDGPARLHRWIDRNLAAGVDRMLVFLDDPEQTALADELDSRPGVVAVGAAWWWADSDRPGKLNVRQRVNSNAAVDVLNRVDPTGWAFHIDGDEVPHLDKARLLALPDEVGAVQLSPLEAVAQWEWPDDEVTVFKRLLSEEELNLLLLLGRVERAENSYWFRGHVTGKAGVRLGTDAWLGIHRVVDAERNALPHHSADWLQLLHYESHTYDEFVRKWTNLVRSGPPVVARHNRGRLGSAMRAPQWDSWSSDVAERVRRELFTRTTLDDRAALAELGVLVEPAAVPPYDGPAGDLRLDAIRAALRDLAAEDKSRYRLAGGA